MALSLSFFATLHLTLLFLVFLVNPLAINGYSDEDIDSEFILFHQDYTPPAPPPPPPHPPSVSCEDDLGGVGSLDTTCKIVSNVNITKSVYIEGKGNFYVLPNVTFKCTFLGCEIGINVTGNFTLGENSVILAGTFQLVADNATFSNSSAVNTTGLAGSAPAQTSGTPQGVEGAGGGYGGRGAGCLTDKKKMPEDVWGGDAYGWSTLQTPWSYGSKGGTTSKTVDYGGGGGGRLMLLVDKFLEVNGSLLADGGDGGVKGGGGSGGSIQIRAYKMMELAELAEISSGTWRPSKLKRRGAKFLAASSSENRSRSTYSNALGFGGVLLGNLRGGV